jgi:hypothetical protein
LYRYTKVVSSSSGRKLKLASSSISMGIKMKTQKRGFPAAGVAVGLHIDENEALSPERSASGNVASGNVAATATTSSRPTQASIAAARADGLPIKSDLRWLLSDPQRRDPGLEITAADHLADFEDDQAVLLKWASLHLGRSVSDGPLKMEHLANPRMLAHLLAVLTDGLGGAYPGDPTLEGLNFQQMVTKVLEVGGCTS